MRPVLWRKSLKSAIYSPMNHDEAMRTIRLTAIVNRERKRYMQALAAGDMEAAKRAAFRWTLAEGRGGACLGN